MKLINVISCLNEILMAIRHKGNGLKDLISLNKLVFLSIYWLIFGFIVIVIGILLVKYKNKRFYKKRRPYL